MTTLLGGFGRGASTTVGDDLSIDWTTALSAYPGGEVALAAVFAVTSTVQPSSSWRTLASGSVGTLSYWLGYASLPASDPSVLLLGGGPPTYPDGNGVYTAYTRVFSGTSGACLVGIETFAETTRARFFQTDANPDVLRQQVVGAVPVGTVDITIEIDPYSDDVEYDRGISSVSSAVTDFRNSINTYGDETGGVPRIFNASTFELVAYESGVFGGPELAANWVSLAVDMRPCSTPPLRQNQRDDIRQGQRTSRQLTVRQVGYL